MIARLRRFVGHLRDSIGNSMGKLARAGDQSVTNGETHGYVLENA